VQLPNNFVKRLSCRPGRCIARRFVFNDIGRIDVYPFDFSKIIQTACQSDSSNCIHSLRQYLHIEAVFVFAWCVDHLSAPLAGRPIGAALVLFKASAMLNLVYRVVPTCAALGYGSARASVRASLRGCIDAIVCDGARIPGHFRRSTRPPRFEPLDCRQDES
jgi:hypothetical protein